MTSAIQGPAVRVAPPRWVSGTHVSDADRKGRFGVYYLRTLVAQAGWASQETSPGEDHKVVDLRAEHGEGSIQIQVKCGTATTHGQSASGGDGYIGVRLTRGQVARLKRQTEPVYVVYVRVPNSPREWVRHAKSGITGPVSAHWVRFDREMTGLTVRVPIKNQFTADTLAEWREDSLSGFTVGGGA